MEEQEAQGISVGSFTRLCLKETFKTTLEKTDAITGVVGLAGGAIAYCIPSWETWLTHGLLIVPLAALATVTLFRLIASPFLVYRRRDLEARILADRLEVEDDEENIQEILGNLQNEGADLRVDFPEDNFQLEHWIERITAWKYKAIDSLGELGLAADYAHFQNADALGDDPPISATTDWRATAKEYDHILRNHLRALDRILHSRPKITFKSKELHERERF